MAEKRVKTDNLTRFRTKSSKAVMITARETGRREYLSMLWVSRANGAAERRFWKTVCHHKDNLAIHDPNRQCRPERRAKPGAKRSRRQAPRKEAVGKRPGRKPTASAQEGSRRKRAPERRKRAQEPTSAAPAPETALEAADKRPGRKPPETCPGTPERPQEPTSIGNRHRPPETSGSPCIRSIRKEHAVAGSHPIRCRRHRLPGSLIRPMKRMSPV